MPTLTDTRTRVIAAGAIPAAWGIVSGVWTPRGPLTTSQALITMAISVLVGAASGSLLRSRWAMLGAPLLTAAVIEIIRLGVDGPTVDGIHLSAYGILTLVVGRGFHGLVGLVPMVFGATIGAGMARRRGDGEPWSVRPTSRTGLYGRRTVAVLCGVALVGLALAVARPASTDEIVGADGEALPDSVAELTTVDVGGADLGLMLRGSSAENPVLLFLAGGPGGSERGAMRNHLEALEDSFVVATWDQRGTGTSYPALDPTSTLTLDAAVADTLAVTDYLRQRFDQERIYVVGQSWGSILGVLAVQESPERFRAFVGTGQMVSPLETDRLIYDDTLEWATDAGDDALADSLRDIGPPPYDRMLDYETALAYEHEVYPYDHSTNSEGEGGFSENFIVPEYTLTDQIHLLAGFVDTFAALYPQIQDIDFRTGATDFEVPVFFVQGRREAPGRSEPFDEWYPMIEAPTKDMVVLSTSGHRPLFEQPDEFVAYMVDTVLAST